MKVDSVGFEHASEIAKTKAMMHDETGKLGKGVLPEENSSEVILDIIDVIESPSQEEMESQLFVADIKDEMMAIENNEILSEDEKMSVEELVASAVDNISILANNNVNKYTLAIETIQMSMKDNPNNANDIKQNIIDVLNESIASL